MMNGYIINLIDEIHVLKNIEMKIYRDFIKFKSLYSDREYDFNKSEIIQVRIYSDRKKLEEGKNE